MTKGISNLTGKPPMLGRHHSEESKEKMRNSTIGSKLSAEAKQKISDSLSGMPSRNKGKKWTQEHTAIISKRYSGVNNPMYGKKHSPETIEKLRIARLGKGLSIETRNKISEKSKLMVGELHWNWQGGKTHRNHKDRKCFSTTISQLVFARDNYICQVCNSSSDYLHADHIKSWSEYPELLFDINNCRTLCRACHYYLTFKRALPSTSKWGISSKKELSK